MGRQHFHPVYIFWDPWRDCRLQWL